jgi:glycosyltransferase involved in cell wall biosynthesis
MTSSAATPHLRHLAGSATPPVAAPSASSKTELVALLVVASEDDGGMARSVYLLARDLRECGVRPHLVLHREGRLGEQLRAADLSFETLPELIETVLRGRDPNDRGVSALGRNLRCAPRAVIRLREIAARVGASVIYSHGTWSSYLAAAVGTLSRTPPVVWHVRNDHSPFLTRWGGRALARIGGVQAIIAVSEAAARPYRGSRARLRVVMNGVDLATAGSGAKHPVSRDQLGVGTDAIVVGFAGRLATHKGIWVLMEAFKLAAARSPSLHLVVMGESARHATVNQVEKLRSQAAAWGLLSHVHLQGYIDHVESHLAACDLVVVPSLCLDSCPRTALEALAVGTPVVASRIGGIPEIVRDGLTGILVHPDSPADLADAIVALARDPDRRHSMARAALGDAAHRFDSRRTAADVAEVLHSVSWIGLTRGR